MKIWWPGRPWPLTASYPVRSRTHSPHLLKVKHRRLPLHPLLKLDESGKGRRLPINRQWVREMQWFRLLPDQPEVLSSKSCKPKSGRVLRPPLKLCWRGSLNFCWTASLYLRLLVCGCGRKVREAVLLRLGYGSPSARWCTCLWRRDGGVCGA